MKQLCSVEDGLAAKQAERERLSKVLTATHGEVIAVKKAHEELKAHVYDALIDGKETDLDKAATAIQASEAQVEIAVGKLQRLTETRLSLANQYVLVDERKRQS